MCQAMMVPRKPSKQHKRVSWSNSDSSTSEKENQTAISTPNAPTPTSSSMLEVTSSMLTIDSTNCHCLVLPSHISWVNEALAYMKEQEAKNDKFKVELLAINKENVEIHWQGVVAQTVFQEVLLKMLEHTLEST